MKRDDEEGEMSEIKRGDATVAETSTTTETGSIEDLEALMSPLEDAKTATRNIEAHESALHNTIPRKETPEKVLQAR